MWSPLSWDLKPCCGTSPCIVWPALYAGWGSARPTAAALLAWNPLEPRAARTRALITYPSYWDPVTQPSEVETLMSIWPCSVGVVEPPGVAGGVRDEALEKTSPEAFLRDPQGSQLLFRSRRTRQLPAGATAVV